MNHPKPEEFVPYIYGETTGSARRQLAEHLKDCAQCREEIESWQRSVKGLDSWKLPRRPPTQLAIAAPFLKWAAAAAMVLFAGIVIGRATAPRIDLEKLRAEIAPQIQKELGSQIAQLAREEAAKAVTVNLDSNRRYTDQIAQQLYIALETVALNADKGLRDTAQQLVQLADYKQPENSPNR